MATYTDNYKLKKPAPEDFADIADLNENADKIDAALKDKADLDESGKLKESQLPSLSYIPASQKGAAGGVASLGSDGKVPSGQLPAMDYIDVYKRQTRYSPARISTFPAWLRRPLLSPTEVMRPCLLCWTGVPTARSLP